MRLLYIHNDYAKPSGEETAAEAIVGLLKEHGHEVEWHRRSSAEIAGSAFEKKLDSIPPKSDAKSGNIVS